MKPSLARNLDDIVRKAIGHAAPTPALVVFDTRSPLAQLLADGYRAALPHAVFVDLTPADSECVRGVMDAVGALPPGSLVVLVQSTRFDMGVSRFRLELFRRRLQVIEHPHLGRMQASELPIYVDALAYDPAYYRVLGGALKARIDAAGTIRLVSPFGDLVYAGPFEDTKLNVGDYTGAANVGGQFPIGEVFTEPVDLGEINGVVPIAAFGAQDFSVVFLDEPFALRIERGQVVEAPGAPPAFAEILASIAAEEGPVWVRELGFGINRALTATRRVNDVSTYERMCGIHLSLGAKHAVYAKPGFNKRRTRFHVDVFCAPTRVEIDDAVVFAEGEYRV